MTTKSSSQKAVVSLTKYSQESEAVYTATSEAIQLIQTLGDTSDQWKSNPSQAWSQLDTARTKLMTAWDTLQQRIDANDRNNKSKDQAATEDVALLDERIQVEYMDMITDAFQDVLEELRQSEGDTLDVDALVDCLQSGLELLTSSQDDDESKWFLHYQSSFAATRDADEAAKNDDGLTPHERRRRMMGYDVDHEEDDDDDS